jgi:hypothetical protein
MNRSVATTVFDAMAREEWRLHAALFGGRRFVAFPLFVALVGAGAVWLLVWTGSAPAVIATWLHLLVLAFGLYTGSSGLVGRDALRDLLGDVTLIVFSARTLPVSERTLLAIFLAKDVAYYAGLFLVPLTVAYAPAALPAGALLRLPLLWLTLSGTFIVGIVVTFSAIAVQSRGWREQTVLLVVAAALGLAWAAGVDLVAYLPYGFYRDGPGIRPILGVGATAVAAVVSLHLFDPTHERTTRTAAPRFTAWRRRLRFDTDGLLTKTLFDVGRSSGGFWKVPFSGGVLFLVSAALVSLAGSITGVAPSTGLSFGAILGLSAFTTYNWVTQFDDLEPYLAYPLSAEAVFEAKFRAFIVLGIPVALGYYALAIALWGERVPVALAGGVLLVGLSLYLFGLTVALAGLSPNEFLFDTARFAGFTVGAAVPLVPILIVGFVVAPSTPELVGLAGIGLGLGGIGVALFRWSKPRWAARYRAG